MYTKKFIFSSLAVIILIIALVLVVTKTSPQSTLEEKETEIETISFEEPEHYKTTIAESNYSEHLITLEMYEDTTARMIFDYKSTEGAPENITIREELGYWRFSDDAHEMTLTINSYGELDGENYFDIQPPRTITFIRTPDGIEATAYDTEQYPYDFLNFIPVPEDEMYRYGDYLSFKI